MHGTQPEVVDGAWSGDLVIIGFPSVEAARDWYASPEYQAILHLRTEHSDSAAVIVGGVPLGYRAADTLAKLGIG